MKVNSGTLTGNHDNGDNGNLIEETITLLLLHGVKILTEYTLHGVKILTECSEFSYLNNKIANFVGPFWYIDWRS